MAVRLISVKSGFLLLTFWLAMASPVALASMEQAQQYFDTDQHDKALSVVNDVLKRDADNPEARFMKGLVLVQQGKNNEAIQIFTKLTADYPELPEPYNNLAVIYAGQGQYDKARDALKAALKTHPSYTTAYVNLGDIYAKLASEAYQQALELDKQDSEQIKVKLSLIDKLFPGQPRPAAKSVALPATTQVAAVKPEPKPAAQPAPKPVSKPAPPTTDLGAEKRQLFADIKGWSVAWSAQDVDGYLSYYDANFKPRQGSASEWRRQRYDRLRKPEFIKVTLSDVKVTKLSPVVAEVTLKQRYEADHYKDSTRKRITFARHSDGWKILREKVIY